MRTNTTPQEIQHYFEYSNLGLEVVQDGLQHISFGEYLADQGAITRFQLFQALQLQDKHPGVRIGECVAALGYLSYRDIERHLRSWNRVSVVEA